MTPLTHLRAGPAHLQLAPELGGAIAALTADGRPVLHPWSNDPARFNPASMVLVPFSNRISGGGFTWHGRRHDVPCDADRPLPIHGDGYRRAWEIVVDGAAARMTLAQGAIGPWRYTAAQDITLAPDALSVTMTLTNTGPHPLPFGGGFHPGLPRSADTRLQFDAATVWLEDNSHLPTQELPLASAPEWRFDTPRALPDGLINNGYTGWTGAARITQGPDAVSCVIRGIGAPFAQVYSTGAQADFFCFEPVSHPVDAVNLPGQPGLADLPPGVNMQIGMHIAWG
ncbi:aldose 1-epimerase [Actibacterium mucosum]|uniref:aldose 1-epimerase n=1 Tax=Actibacterium mucosum TaxID=1087332 RepID=UPI0006918481|nr:aldose 1-epimerase [Actibacterium mucosum]